MAPIGHLTQPTARLDALSRARQRAALLPDCLAEARRVANTVIAGWHGRRKRGIGETFWQFRPYVDGESLSRIDWRRSARDDHLYVRDREWEAAHTIWLWADQSPSMLYKSDVAMVGKESRALVLMLALAEILARSGERVGCPGVMEPVASRNAAERLALALSHAPRQTALPDLGRVGRMSDVVLIGDFLDPDETLERCIGPAARRGIRGHIIEISDPAEENFPYSGRTEFRDPETGQKLVAGRAETVAADYRRAWLARREVLAQGVRRMGWSFLSHSTDRPASAALAAAHGHLSGIPAATKTVPA
ncbi:MAG: DUF58 domain-containing protein [Hoeflea sp.]|uniref:DUF58 domain-containing protein n=1 Tax=Hoeflea sp. TaxID=1940281 RepID=UPI001DD18B17|nr:DUF58 domain-containing protein [Hoeflea sp.]MBU4527264.1 DUF58 domain-containing protein [Alphaproteobacteria bacterium]MBU4546953.1 DUF58 domain-containing protein [Alphaproteobacteria bacterium]MBU4551535.1 DUF58 domain-containing protein [Alphaproteobacteria bacterium]MBV1725540.1 DUF58 domain-containing protein [Hoeflea sp.]MBV1759588.1 DUF58 domain-containing protein [Hoeflea sp.]